MLRRRKVLATVKELDAFPKVPETYKETSTAGRGTLSVATFLLIAVLIVSEIKYHMDSDLKFDYKVDLDHNETVKLNLDITVAMQCGYLGADVLDVSNKQNAWISAGQIEEDAVFFDLSPKQQQYQSMVEAVNLRVKNEYHAVHKFLWKSGFNSLNNMPPREDKPDKQPDACRYHGTVEVGKVAGNFHITAGRSIPFPGGHAHLAMAFGTEVYNFSHRIDEFSFGHRTPGKMNPLDGDMRTTNSNFHVFQYFLQVVPTAVSTSHAQLDTFQYAVTEQNRKLNHDQGSHGVPGIFMKYDFASFKVDVSEVSPPWYQLVVRVCGIVGGVFATSTMLTSYADSLRHLWRMLVGRSTGKDGGGKVVPDSPCSPTPRGFVPKSPYSSTSLSHDHLLSLSPAKSSFIGVAADQPLMEGLSSVT